MSSPDNLQALWQQNTSEKEKNSMWMQLIDEKRSGFNELVQLGNEMEYLVALIMGPLMAFVAWKAKFTWGHIGFGLLAASFVAVGAATWIASRQWPSRNDHSLRAHILALIECYDRRVRFLRNGKVLVCLPMAVGLFAVVMSVPGAFNTIGAWVANCVLIGGLFWGQWRSYTSAKIAILKKREEAEALLRELPTSQRS